MRTNINKDNTAKNKDDDKVKTNENREPRTENDERLSWTDYDRLLICERHNTPCQDTSVSLGHRSIRAEGTVKTLHSSDLSLLYEEITITTFAILAYTYYIYFAYSLYTTHRSLLPICSDLFLIFRSLYLQTVR